MLLTLCASPAILGITAASPKMASSNVPMLGGRGRVVLRPPGTGKLFPVGSTDGIRGYGVKTGMKKRMKKAVLE